MFHSKSTLQFLTFKKTLCRFQSSWLSSLTTIQTMCYTIRTLNCPSIILPEDEKTFRLDLSLGQEASNCYSLHPSGRFSSTSRRRSMFDQIWDFFPKHRDEKTAATVQTRSFIRQVVHSKFNRPDNSIYGPDAQASYMKIVCIRSTVWTTTVIVQTHQALIWKLRIVKVRPSGR
jgi:hypothetical protein